MFKAYYGYEDLVSILAPLARGALQGTAWNREIAIIVSILAPLARGALRRKNVGSCRKIMFQSSPLSQEGRYCRGEDDLRDHGGFNPRPSRKRGATQRRTET